MCGDSRDSVQEDRVEFERISMGTMEECVLTPDPGRPLVWMGEVERPLTEPLSSTGCPQGGLCKVFHLISKEDVKSCYKLLEFRLSLKPGSIWVCKEERVVSEERRLEEHR